MDDAKPNVREPIVDSLRDFLLGADPINVAEVWTDTHAQREEYDILASTWDRTQTAEQFATVLAMCTDDTDVITDPIVYEKALGVMRRFYQYYVD